MNKDKVMKYLSDKIFFNAGKTMFMNSKEFNEMKEVFDYLRENLQ